MPKTLKEVVSQSKKANSTYKKAVEGDGLTIEKVRKQGRFRQANLRDNQDAAGAKRRTATLTKKHIEILKEGKELLGFKSQDEVIQAAIEMLGKSLAELKINKEK